MSVRKPICPAQQTSTSVNKNPTIETSIEQISFDLAETNNRRHIYDEDAYFSPRPYSKPI